MPGSEPQEHHKSQLEQASFLLLVAGVTLLLLAIAWPFASPVLWAGLAAIMFQPLYQRVLRQVKGRANTAAIISLTIIFFAVLVPALIIGTLVVEEAARVVFGLRAGDINIASWFDAIYAALPESLRTGIANAGFSDFSSLQARLQALLGESAGLIAQQAVSIGSGAFGFVLAFGLGLYVSYFLLRDGLSIGETILSSVPLERDIADRLAARFLSIVRATIKGSLVVGVVQGALGAITFSIVGIPSAILFGVLMGISSLLPAVGTGLVWVPAVIYLFATGAIWEAGVVLVSGFLVIGMVDNVLRPILVGRDTGIPDWIILITTLGGISLVGFSGIVLGPLVAGLFLASWSILREQREEDEEATLQPGSINVDASGRVPDTAGTD